MKKRLISLVLVIAMALTLVPAAFAYTHDWDTAYEQAVLKNTDKYGCMIQVLDIDMDGMPELLIGGAVGSGVFSAMEKAFTFKNGAAVELNLAQDFICLGNSYEMYRNQATGAYRLEEEYLVRAGAGYYGTYISTMNVSNGTLSKEDIFADETSGSTKSYYQQGVNLGSEAAYNAAVAAWHTGWTKVDDYVVIEKYFSYKKPTSAELQELFAQYPGTAASAPATLTVTVTAQGNGTVTGAGDYKEGEKAILTATPGTGAKFVGWYSVNGTPLGANPTIEIEVRSDTSLAVFAKFENIASFEEVSTSNGSLSNFGAINTYRPGQFSDVVSGAWYEENVKVSYEYGLVLGYGDGMFGVGADISIAQVVAIADRLHNRYYGGSGVFVQGEPWYQIYMDYAVKYGIISSGQYDPLATATRVQFATILSAALPDAALTPINNVTALPDVNENASYLPAVLRLYNAGILTGSDEYGTFEPEKPIGREQVAAMAARFADPTLRKKYSLKTKDSEMAWLRIDENMGVENYGEIDYLNTKWFKIALPAALPWICISSEDGLSLTFYYEPSYEKDDGYDGQFLTICAFDHDDLSFEYYPQYCVAIKDRYKTYVAIYPSDVRVNPDDPVAQEEYEYLLGWAYLLDSENSPFEVLYP